MIFDIRQWTDGDFSKHFVCLRFDDGSEFDIVDHRNVISAFDKQYRIDRHFFLVQTKRK